MYTPALQFERTEEQRRDPLASWAREDQAFFASGACHILAVAFLRRRQGPGHGFEMIYLRPSEGFAGSHVYVSNGHWAFDHNGWTREPELLAATQAAYQQRYPGWQCERAVITDVLETFCRMNNHRLPEQYAFCPWERAEMYLENAGGGMDPPSG